MVFEKVLLCSGGDLGGSERAADTAAGVHVLQYHAEEAAGGPARDRAPGHPRQRVR